MKTTIFELDGAERALVLQALDHWAEYCNQKAETGSLVVKVRHEDNRARAYALWQRLHDTKPGYHHD